MEIKRCPSCQKNVLAIARVCKHCGYSFDAPKTTKESKEGGEKLTAGFTDDCDIVYELPKMGTDDTDAKKAEFRAETARHGQYIPPKRDMFSNLFSFYDRCRRMEYWLTILLFDIVLVAGAFFASSCMLGVLLSPVIYFGAIWALLAQGAKRCHDLGHSGWFQLIPFYVFWMLFADGDPEQNAYGYSPK